jgi:Cd2+/Zn2+-exporting ATPase
MVECETCAFDESLDEDEEIDLEFWNTSKMKRILLSIPLLLAGLLFEAFTQYTLLFQVFFLSVVILSGKELIINGVGNLFKKKISINFLITIAALGAFLIGHGEEGAAVILLFSIAEYLEEYAGRKSKYSIRELLKTAPSIASVLRKGKETRVHVHDVRVGEIVVIRPGEKIPLDGVVIKGESHVDESHLTGESVPVRKRENDYVYAGTINLDGYFEIRVEKESKDSLLARITKLVENAQKRKSQTEKFIDKFAHYYTPAVIFLAILTAIIPTFIFGEPLEVWIYRALVLLVVSCPCALAISTPVSMVSAITGAAKNGVLIKGSNVIERLDKIEAFALDKTGTLTEGKLEVSKIVTLDEIDASEVLSIAASLEALSEHPIARAIVKKAELEGITLKKVDDFRAIAGSGVVGVIEGIEYRIGRPDLMESIPEDLYEDSNGFSIVIGTKDRVLGAILIRDKTREDAAHVIASLREMGIKTIMLTGDNKQVAEKVGEAIEIDEIYYELFPEDKSKMMQLP